LLFYGVGIYSVLFMLTIRLNRIGKKNKPYFRIVLQEHTIAPGGRHVEVLGSYDPHMKKAIFNAEKIKYWISKGAQASDTVHNLLIKNGITEGDKRKVKLPAKKVEEVKEEVKQEAAPAEAKEEAPAEVKEPARNASPSDAGGEVKVAEAPIEEKKEEASKAE
jgi:small subunit ribosomal protein S16